ncbi:MAG: arginine--tRNA ligase, partial [Bacteroidales bacterium]|nr:arginine--tRNA ligase [Bacteroidales bacterium]
MIEDILAGKTAEAISLLFGHHLDPSAVTVQKTRPEFEGDLTVVIFPITRFSGTSPEETGRLLGNWLRENVGIVESFNVVKGFLNLVISNEFWMNFFTSGLGNPSYGFAEEDEHPPVVIEYSSPNTNKPLHLGHIRNNLLGWSIAEILKANGKKVIKVNLVNDRGIHICKTMLAYRKWAGGKRPGDKGMKGDKFVGNLYVQFEQANKAEMEKLIKEGLSEDGAYKQSGLTRQALDLLQLWEGGDKDTRELWRTMNSWVYEGFDQTYKRLGVSFDKIYYESETYLLGKELVIAKLVMSLRDLRKCRDTASFIRWDGTPL